MASLIAGLGLRASLATVGRRARDRLMRAAEDPQGAQARALAGVLRACSGTDIGRRHELSSVEGVDAFRARVPISDYEALRVAVLRQIASARPVVSPTRPLMYARTSGTTGTPKYVPVTAAVLGQLKRAQRIMAYVQHAELDAFRGRVLGIGGPRCEERLPDGTPAGAVTGLIYETMPRALRAKYVVPAPVFGIEDYELKYALLARLALRAGDISAIATANPSTILRLVDLARESLPTILREMDSGDVPLLSAVSPGLRRALRVLERPDPARAAAL
ncbi:MAG TPA: GH3 auxin-responsive promoter family protein, partial [Alphaproteobacteria bacterium]